MYSLSATFWALSLRQFKKKLQLNLFDAFWFISNFIGFMQHVTIFLIHNQCDSRSSWQPLNLEQYDMVRNMASKIYAYAPEARVLTTYYCGKNSLIALSVPISFC